MLWNVENLFIYIDKPLQSDLASLSEEQWQRLSKATTPNKYLNKILDLKRCIKNNDPDILMLNEVGGTESIENFNTYFLDSAYQAHLIEGNSDRGIDVGYLVKKSLPYDVNLSSHKNTQIDLQYPGDAADKKYYLSRDIAELNLSANNQTKAILLLTHLKSKLDPEGIDTEGITRRTAEARLLTDVYIEKQNSNPDTPVFVAGDFNGILKDPRHSEFQYLRDKTPLVDVLNYSKAYKNEKRVTQVQFRMNLRTDYQFDYILLNPKFANRIDENETFIDLLTDANNSPLTLPRTLEQRFSLPSDHYPVITKINLLD